MLARMRPVILCLLVSVGCAPADPHSTLPDAMSDPPPTRRDNVVDVLHDVEIVDPYRWLEDQDSPETRAWIGDQNAYSSSHLGDHPRRAALAARLSELMRIDQVAAPRQRGERYFLWKKEAEADLWVLHLRQGLEGEDEVLIDPHTLSGDHTTSVGIGAISQDGQLLAYEVREGGVDETSIRILDVET
ncbi:MAG: S9 family peptidase, partial [Acidobacteriota bacterium]